MRVVLDAAAGGTYLIMVAGDPQAADAGFSLRVRPLAPPRNDAFADARALRIPGRYAGTVLDASAELGEPRHVAAAEHSVWYRVTPRRTGRLTLEARTATATPRSPSTSAPSSATCGAWRARSGGLSASSRPAAARTTWPST